MSQLTRRRSRRGRGVPRSAGCSVRKIKVGRFIDRFNVDRSEGNSSALSTPPIAAVRQYGRGRLIFQECFDFLEIIYQIWTLLDLWDSKWKKTWKNHPEAFLFYPEPLMKMIEKAGTNEQTKTYDALGSLRPKSERGLQDRVCDAFRTAPNSNI